MAPIRFFTDEDVYGATTVALRKAGFDAISTPETGRLGESDESQLEWASNAGRVLVTFNVAHFASLHARRGRFVAATTELCLIEHEICAGRKDFER